MRVFCGENLPRLPLEITDISQQKWGRFHLIYLNTRQSEARYF